MFSLAENFLCTVFLALSGWREEGHHQPKSIHHESIDRATEASRALAPYTHYSPLGLTHPSNPLVISFNWNQLPRFVSTHKYICSHLPQMSWIRLQSSIIPFVSGQHHHHQHSNIRSGQDDGLNAGTANGTSGYIVYSDNHIPGLGYKVTQFFVEMDLDVVVVVAWVVVVWNCEIAGNGSVILQLILCHVKFRSFQLNSANTAVVHLLTYPVTINLLSYSLTDWPSIHPSTIQCQSSRTE